MKHVFKILGLLGLIWLGLLSVDSAAYGQEAVVVTVPGDGQLQGEISAYGGEPILQYCRIDRHLSKTDPAGTVYFEFKACHPENANMLANISWGDGAPDATVERVTCGRWRVPHLYKPGTYEANVVIKWKDGQATCTGDTSGGGGPSPNPACQTPAECWFWPAQAGEVNSIGHALASYVCADRAEIKKCSWTYNGRTNTEEPCRFENGSIAVLAGSTLKASDKISHTLYFKNGTKESVSCKYTPTEPPEANLLTISDDVIVSSVNARVNIFLRSAIADISVARPPLGPLNNNNHETPPQAPLNALAGIVGWPGFGWLWTFLLGAVGAIIVGRNINLRK